MSSAKNPKPAQKTDDNLYSVRFSLHADYTLNWTAEPSDYLSRFFAELTCHDFSREDNDYKGELAVDPPGVTSDPNEPDTKIIGKLDGMLFPFGKHFNDPSADSIFDILDSHSQDTYEYYDAFFKDNKLKNHFSRECGLLPHNILLLDTMEIAPSFRGKGLGLTLLRAVADAPFLPHQTFVGLRPWAMGHKHDEAAEKIGTKKLFSYWKRAGYKRIPNTEFLYKYIP